MLMRAFESFRRNSGMLALFLVLAGGTAYAVDGPNPGQNTIGSEDIIGNEVKSDDIGNGRIFNLDIADDIIQSGKIKDGTLVPADHAPPPDPQDVTAGPGYTSSLDCYRDAAGTVHFVGSVQATSSAGTTLVSTLPGDCLPHASGGQTVVRQSASGFNLSGALISISTSGTIGLDSSVPLDTQRIDLSGLSYRGATD